jgi:hypothetical protein
VKNTKQNLNFCVRQVARLEVTNFFAGLTEIGLAELRNALCAAASSLSQAELIISTWIGRSKDRPTPADLYEIAATMNAANSGQPAPCQDCEALGGFVAREVTITRGVFAGETHRELVPCHCALGQAKRQAFRQMRGTGPDDPKAELEPLNPPTIGDEDSKEVIQ